MPIAAWTELRRAEAFAYSCPYMSATISRFGLSILTYIKMHKPIYMYIHIYRVNTYAHVCAHKCDLMRQFAPLPLSCFFVPKQPRSNSNINRLYIFTFQMPKQEMNFKLDIAIICYIYRIPSHIGFMHRHLFREL